MQKRVDFWVKIYSHYTTSQGVFHLVDDPSKILGEIDLTSIHQNKVLNDTQKRKLIDAEIKKKRQLYITRHKIKNPRQVRLQMGLKDRMRKAFYLSGKYLPQMEEIFEKENLPIELTRLVFVESSFNVYAQSKVGASGLWQIMPFVARPKGYITNHYDKRNHPVYATKLAAQILKQNHRSLKSWPLAVTAYNHGLTGVKRMMQRSEAVSIEGLIRSQNPTRTWGFASKNFYACFLAVLEVERRATDLFGDNLLKAHALSFREYKLPEATNKDVVLKWFGGSMTRFRQMNPHLNWAVIRNRQSVPAGVPLMIPEQNFYLVAN
ncbi:membrane-bound lytic murein transglycosylase, putative [Pseudobdellovibrio exovorus JSS]|uniref:Membrane-bound lytic murein transglycosylase, putative n=2 Tax=Pseudobdellovibrio exovorus TaxID=453816 RepID=M4VDY9_9BACT|nr:membrane-bound lytic murein transglycosylase, putative [Pseudobdellovibrio exovorus JSS]